MPDIGNGGNRGKMPSGKKNIYSTDGWGLLKGRLGPSSSMGNGD
jgi:hypothetical protein